MNIYFSFILPPYSIGRCASLAGSVTEPNAISSLAFHHSACRRFSSCRAPRQDHNIWTLPSIYHIEKKHNIVTSPYTFQNAAAKEIDYAGHADNICNMVDAWK